MSGSVSVVCVRRLHPALFPKAGTALDVAGGLGRHATWLAELRLKVTVVDISEVAFQKAQRKAEERGVEIDFFVRDLNSWSPECRKYDLAVVFFYMQRDLLLALEAALKPGGLPRRRRAWIETVAATSSTLLSPAASPAALPTDQ